MKKLLLLFILVSQLCFSQLGKTKSEIFSNEQRAYTDKDIQNEFTVYNYSGKIEKLNGENCHEIVSYFIENKSEKCFQETYTSCASVANVYAKFFNENFVKIELNKWKDYVNNSIYTLKVEGKFSYVQHYYDYNK